MPETNSSEIDKALETSRLNTYSRQEVLSAFNASYKAFSEDTNKLTARLNKTTKENEDKKNVFNENELRQLDDWRITTFGKEKVIKKGEIVNNGKIKVKLNNGKISEEEIPIEGILDFLSNKIEKLNANTNNTKEQGKELEEYRKNLDILKKNSVSYKEKFKLKEIKKRINNLVEGRKQLEALSVSESPFSASTNPNDEERMKEDWFQGERNLERRIGLVFPTNKIQAVQAEGNLKKIITDGALEEKVGGLPEEEKDTRDLKEVEQREFNLENNTDHDQEIDSLNEKIDTKDLKEGGKKDITKKIKTKEVILENHLSPFVEDYPDNISGIVSFEDVKQAASEPSPQDSDKVKDLRSRMNKVKSFINSADVQQTLSDLVSKQERESDRDHQIHILEAVINRLTFLGDFEKQQDPLSQLLINKGLRGEVITPQLLQAAEGMLYLELDSQNKEKMEQYEMSKKEGKFDIATLVSLERGVVEIGGSAPIYEDTPNGRVRKEQAERDNRAALLLSNAFASLPYSEIIDPITGIKKIVSFSEKIEPLLARMKIEPDEKIKEDVRRKVQLEYKEYLNKLTEAMKKREKPSNPFGNDEIFQKKAYELMQDLKPPFNQDKLNKLIDLYQQNPSFKRLNLSAQDSAMIKKFRSTFEKDIGALPDFLGTAQKGIDYLERRMELTRIPKPELAEIPAEIYAKRWKEDGEYHRYHKAIGIGISASKDGNIPNLSVAPLQTTESGKEISPESEDSSRAGKELESKLKELTPVPLNEEKNENKPGENSVIPLSDERTPVMEYNLAVVEAPNAVMINHGEISSHAISLDQELWEKRQLIKSPLDKVSVLRMIGHPIEFIFRKKVLKDWYDRQNERFCADVMVKVSKGVGVDPSVPIGVSREMITIALRKGSAMRNKNIFTRLASEATDLFTRTTGLFQNSEQRLAKKWIDEQINLLKSNSSNVDADFKKEWERMTKGETSAFKQQDDEGLRFASLGGFGSLEALQQRLGCTRDQALKFANEQGIISLDQGELRFVLSKEVNQQASQKIKGFIATYAQAVSNITNTAVIEQKQKELLAETNKFFRSDEFNNLLPAELKDQLKNHQIANNILSIAKQVAEDWTLLQQKNENGIPKWESVNLDIFAGNSEWGNVRGAKKERAKITENLARKMLESKLGVMSTRGTELGYRAYETSKILGIVPYAVAYAAGYTLTGAAASLLRIPQTALKIGQYFAPVAGVGGVALVGVTAGVSEVGLKIPVLGNRHRWAYFKGKLQLEREQVSAEIAFGREGMGDKRVREKLQTTLLETVSAVTTTKELNDLINNLSSEGSQDDKISSLYKKLLAADARLRLTDKSRTAGLGFDVQNLFTYTEGLDKAEAAQLRNAILQAKIQLFSAVKDNPQLAQKLMLTTGNINDFAKLYDQMCLLAEGQLRLGSEEAQRKDVGKWLQKQNVSKDDVNKLLASFGSADIDIRKENALKTKEKNMSKLKAKRFLSTTLITMATAPIAGAIYGGIASELQSVIGDIQHLGLGGGVTEYVQDWSNIIHGNIPLKEEGGNVIADVSKVQDGFLFVRNKFFEPPADFTSVHNVQIDGVNIQLPAGLRYDSDHRVILDLKTNSVIADLRNSHFGFQDINHDGQPELTINQAGRVMTGQEFSQALHQRTGVDLIHDNSLDTAHEERVTTLARGGSHEQTINGVNISVPDHTRWVQDGDKFDLKTDDGRILIDNANIDSHGQISGGINNYPNNIKINAGHEALSQSPQVEVIHPQEFWHEHASKIGYTEYQNEGGEGHIQLKKEGNALEIGIEKVVAHKGDDTISVDDLVAKNQLYARFQVRGIGSVVINTNADGVNDNFLRLDPNDHDPSHFVTLPNGTRLQLGEFAKIVVDQNELSKYDSGNLYGQGENIGGDFGTKTLKLLNPDLVRGPQRGSISFGQYISGNYKYTGPSTDILQTGETLHGYLKAFSQADVGIGSIHDTVSNLPPIESETLPGSVTLLNDIQTIIKTTEPGFRMEAPENNTLIDLIPITSRTPVGPSKRPGEETKKQETTPENKSVETENNEEVDSTIEEKVKKQEYEEKHKAQVKKYIEELKNDIQTWKNQPEVDLNLLKLNKKDLGALEEKEGTLEGATLCRDASGGVTGYETYQDEKGGMIIRSQKTGNHLFKFISPNGTFGEIKANQGQTINDDCYFITDDEKIYSLKNNAFIQVNEEEAKKIKERPNYGRSNVA